MSKTSKPAAKPAPKKSAPPPQFAKANQQRKHTARAERVGQALASKMY